MKYLACSLFYWLAFSSQAAASVGTDVVSCSGSSVTLTASSSSSVQVGEILVRVDNDNSELCRNDCGVLFREIVEDNGNGVYTTTAATFSQVFPAESYDISYANVPIESVLPDCGEKELHTGTSMMLRHALKAPEDAVAPAPAATPVVTTRQLQFGRKKEDDDDHVYYDDDKYPPEKEEHGVFRMFLDATKKFIFDMYCIIRNLDCAEYNPGGDDTVHYDDDKHYDDDYKSEDKHQRSLLEMEGSHILSSSKKTGSRLMRGIKGGAAPLKRSLQANVEITFGYTEPPTPAPSAFVAETDAETTTVQDEKKKEEDDDDDDHVEGSDDHPYDDDDFFDDDDAYDDDGANFWKILDAIFEYIGSIYCIFADCKAEGHYDDDTYKHDDYYDDKYSGSKDNDKHFRALSEIMEPSMPSLFAANFAPSSQQDWLLLKEDGSCPFTKCSGVDSPSQCYQERHLVEESCRDSLNELFPSDMMDKAWGDLGSACKGQDYCYASNIFEQTYCDEQFYKSLLQACPSNNSGVVLSGSAPLATTDLYESCSLVSILLFTQTQLQSGPVYQEVREQQNLFESNGCHSI